MTTTPPGWYPDAQGTMRWWDGNTWTDHTHDGARQPGQQPDQWSQQPGQPAPLPDQFPYGQQAPYTQTGPQGLQPGQQPYGQQWLQPPAAPKSNTPLFVGIGAAVVVVIAAVVVILLTTGGDDDKAPTVASTANALENVPEATEDPTDDSGGGDAAGAPRDASVEDFCASFDLEAISDLSASGDLSDLAEIQADLLVVGTPADMPDDARRGWEFIASVSTAEEFASMNRSDVEATSRYYAEKCM